uniref:Uncharacterized protein n=2 Tax=Clytia hemisphaerica TaxID=252671 RepID=A0A7M5V8B4_9CNID
ERFTVDEDTENFTPHQTGIPVTSSTECLLHCGIGQCLNSLMENNTCYCTSDDFKSKKLSSTIPNTVFYQKSITKITPAPICYEAKGSGYATFNIPYDGRIKFFKLVHVYGYVSCATYHSRSKWGCSPITGPTVISTLITDNQNKVIVPAGTPSPYGSFNIPGANDMSDELVLHPDTPYEVEGNEEIRIWYGEDLFGADIDNEGRHCIHVYGQFC